MLADKFLIFFISYYAGFLAVLSGIPALSYVTASYSVSYVLALFLIFKLARRAWPAGPLAAASIIMLATSIEYFHYLTKGMSLQGLTDVRMIIYNPLYSSLIVFGLYACYLVTSSPACRSFHLNWSVRMFTWLNTAYIGFWLILSTRLLPVDSVNLIGYLNNNHVSYIALFVVFVLLKLPEHLTLSVAQRRYALAIGIALMALNTTRGALLILLLILASMALKRRNRGVSAGVKWTVAGLACLAAVVVAAALDLHGKVLGAGFGDLYAIVSKLEIDTNLEGRTIEFDRGTTYDDFSVSSVARIYTNYLALVYLLDHPALGIGTAFAYSIKVMGDGIHSFLFLYALSTGVVGMLLLALALRILRIQFNATRLGGVYALLCLPVLVFLNYLPAYFALLFIAARLPAFPPQAATGEAAR